MLESDGEFCLLSPPPFSLGAIFTLETRDVTTWKAIYVLNGIKWIFVQGSERENEMDTLEPFLVPFLVEIVFSPSLHPHPFCFYLTLFSLLHSQLIQPDVH